MAVHTLLQVTEHQRVMDFGINDDTTSTSVYTATDYDSEFEHIALEISEDEFQYDQDQYMVSYLNINFPF